MGEGMRWRVTKAVRRSGLPAPARLVMLTLADVAEVGTAEIPTQRTPSLSVLASETGLDESTVKRYLNALEAGGWLVRTRPTAEAARLRGERTRYRLAIPVGAESAPVGAQEAQEGAGDAQGVGAQNAAPGRTVRPKEEPDLDQMENRSQASEPARLDVERVCQHLADWIEKNGSKRPKITKRWRDAARLMLDADGRTVDQVLKAIDWCQDHEFWRANILSMPKLREQYEQLRLQAQRARASPGTDVARPKESTTDRRVSENLSLLDRFEERPAQ